MSNMVKIIVYLCLTASWAFCSGMSVGSLILSEYYRGLRIFQLITYTGLSIAYGCLTIGLVRNL